MINGRVEHNASAYVDSYSGLPFVDVHAVDHTRMNESFYSIGFDALEKKGDTWQSELSQYDPSHKRIIIEDARHADKNTPPLLPMKHDTLNQVPFPVEDGLSILFFARANIRSGKEVHLPTIVYGKQGITHFWFQKRTEYEEIDALKNKKIRVVPFEGKAEFEGIFGLTGDFKGSCSDDAAAIPIKAELGVLIGSVNIELIRWNRPGWIPPE
jgi:hypothetical protein